MCRHMKSAGDGGGRWRVHLVDGIGRGQDDGSGTVDVCPGAPHQVVGDGGGPVE
jgi:hypothetical protein